MSKCDSCYNLGKGYKGYLLIKLTNTISSGKIEDLADTINTPSQNNSQCVTTITYSLDNKQAIIEFCSLLELGVDDIDTSSLTTLQEKQLFTREEVVAHIELYNDEWNREPIN